jgi:tetratricopeptide (TPR) repeat protein
LAILSNVYEIKGDTAKAISSYERYVQQIKPSLEILKKNNFTIGMSREDVLRSLGKPVSTKAFIDNNGDSLIVDKIAISGDEAYLSSVKKEGGKALIEGIRSNLPSTWLPQEKERFYAINIRPIVNLAYLYYGSKAYDKAVEMIEYSLSINPIDDELASLKIQIYDEQGKQ